MRRRSLFLMLFAVIALTTADKATAGPGLPAPVLPGPCSVCTPGCPVSYCPKPPPAPSLESILRRILHR